MVTIAFLASAGWAIHNFVSGPRSVVYAFVGSLFLLACLRPIILNLAWAFDKLFLLPLRLGKRLGEWTAAEWEEDDSGP